LILSSLAIVIPAFKPDFFSQTLQSINNQTCKDFTLYIGDDNSPDNLDVIVRKELTNIKYVYKKFNSNLGKEDLVAQWNRCIDLTEGEPWIWLFSDDDYLEDNCVEVFYKYAKNFSSKLFRFNKIVVDEQNNTIRHVELPEVVSDSEFIREIGIRNKSITMSEFVFHRDLYNKYGITSFDLAWSSDLATWIQYVIENKRLYNINQSQVYFRVSSSHISSSTEKKVLARKVYADLSFLIWLKPLIEKHKNKLPELAYELNKYQIDRYRKLSGSPVYRSKFYFLFKRKSIKMFGFISFLVETFKIYRFKSLIDFGK